MDAEWTHPLYTGAEMDEDGNERRNEHIVTQKKLYAAYLIRCFNDGRQQAFILEDVATREREPFDSQEALLARLKELFSAGQARGKP